MSYAIPGQELSLSCYGNVKLTHFWGGIDPGRKTNNMERICRHGQTMGRPTLVQMKLDSEL